MYNFQASASNEKTSKELSELFEVDITETLQAVGDCPISSYQICSDLECTNVLPTHSHLILTESNYEIDST